MVAALKNKQGVTLIELLVVVMILGIIAAVAVPTFSNNKANAVNATNQQNIVIIKDALERYKLDKGSYPDTLDKLLPDYLKAVPQPVDSVTGKVSGSYSYNKDTGAVTKP